MRVLFLLAILVAASALAVLSIELLTATIQQAIGNVKLNNMVADDTIGTDRKPHTQVANEESIDAQKIGDIAQEATRLLIEEHGVAGLAQFEGIDVVDMINAQLGPKSGNRKKRQYGESGGTPDPQDVCIDRPRVCDTSVPYRSISGWCNHFDNANRGMGSTMGFIRRFMGGAVPDFDSQYSHMFMQYGQWIAHDLIFTPGSVGANGEALDCSSCESGTLTSNCAPIEIPDDDTYFPTRTASGTKNCIRLTRAINGQTGIGPRAQINQVTHYLDLSQVYGSTDCVARELRTNVSGQMRMYTDDGYMLPPRAFNVSNCQSEKTTPAFQCFRAGDARNSQQPGLTSIQTIYLRQHNKWASHISQLKPRWTDEQVYQETRRLLVAMYQYHIYSEYLPKVVGTNLMTQHDLTPGSLRHLYSPNANPSIYAEFGTAAFRFGHSQARRDIPRTTNSNVSLGAFLDLGANFLYTNAQYDRSATVFHTTQGMVNAASMATDRQFSFPIRNQVFEIRGRKASGIDLPAVNVQRAREMGVMSYNSFLGSIIKPPARTFDDLLEDMDGSSVALLKKTYESVNDIDLYVGLLLEKRRDPTALLGPTACFIIASQFYSLRSGDRFFYQNTQDNAGALSQVEYDAIKGFTFSQLICDNTDGMLMVQEDIFQHNARRVRCADFKPFPMAAIIASRPTIV